MRHDAPRDAVSDDDGYRASLDAIQAKIREASHTDWTGVELTLTPPDVNADDARRRLFDLQREEALVSKRRRELHKRIDFLEGVAVPLNATFAAQLEAFKRTEKRDSAERRRLHREIDRLRDEFVGGLGSERA